MTDPASPRDDFDRIVEGLDLDLTGLEDFDRSAAQAAAARERAELEEEQRRAAEPAEADDQFYRDVGPADLPSDRRTKIAWFVVVGAPALLLLARFASIRPPTFVVAVVVIAVVVAVVYLIARLPDRGPSNPDWPDDGAAL
ncbi:MAG: hypothetical protein ABWZ87_10135 [Aeromicrobium sp.]